MHHSAPAIFHPVVRHPRRDARGWLLAMLGVMLVAGCSSPHGWAEPFYRVDGLLAREEAVYAHVTVVYSLSTGYGTSGNKKPEYYFGSDNGGHWWQEIEPPGKDVVQPLLDPIQKEQPACSSSQPNVCYRLAGTLRIEQSEDGGQTWQLAWQASPVRQSYMAHQGKFGSTIGMEPDISPYDLTVADTDAGAVPIAAMGNQGVLRRVPGGNWERIPVGEAVPVPERASNLSEAGAALRDETRVIVTVTMLLLLALCLIGWSTIRDLLLVSDPTVGRWSCLAIIIGLGSGFMLVIVGLISRSKGETSTAVLLWAVAACYPMLIWLALANEVPQRGAALHAAAACIYHPLILMLVAWMPLVLWATGVLASYQLGSALAVFLGTAAFIWGLWNENRLVDRACQAGQA